MLGLDEMGEIKTQLQKKRRSVRLDGCRRLRVRPCSRPGLLWHRSKFCHGGSARADSLAGKRIAGGTKNQVVLTPDKDEIKLVHGSCESGRNSVGLRNGGVVNSTRMAMADGQFIS